MQVQRNAVSFCQSTVEEICKPIAGNTFIWLDDILFFAKTEGELLIVLETFFDLCKSYNLKLHAKKCQLFCVK